MSQFTELSKSILEKAGGVGNVGGVNHCATRLRLTLNDVSKADLDGIKALPGILGLVNRGQEVQLVIGTDVGNLYLEFIKLGTFAKGGKVNEDGSKNAFGTVIDFVSGTFVPVLPVLVAAGLVNAVLTVLTVFFKLPTISGAYTIFSAINNAGFTFLPFFVGFSAARKIGLNPFMGAYLAAILLSSSINNVALDFFGLPIAAQNYSSSVLPIILGVIFMYWVDKGVDAITPKEIKFFARPLLTMLIVTPVTLVALGPVGIVLGNWLAAFLVWVNTNLGWLSVALMGAVTPILVMTGMNQALFPPVIAAFTNFGYDNFVLPGMLAANVAVGAAALAVMVKSKNANNKALATSAGITGVLGITEPAIFGVLLPFKKPFLGAIAGGAVGGLFAGIVGLKQFGIVSPGLAALPTFIAPDGSMGNFWLAVATLAISVVTSFAVTYFLGFDDSEKSA
jgi:PTS system beta-glucosides-specific IIC component